MNYLQQKKNALIEYSQQSKRNWILNNKKEIKPDVEIKNGYWNSNGAIILNHTYDSRIVFKTIPKLQKYLYVHIKRIDSWDSTYLFNCFINYKKVGFYNTPPNMDSVFIFNTNISPITSIYFQSYYGQLLIDKIWTSDSYDDFGL